MRIEAHPFRSTLAVDRREIAELILQMVGDYVQVKILGSVCHGLDCAEGDARETRS